MLHLRQWLRPGAKFLVDQVFRISPFFSQTFRILTMLNVVCDPFLKKKKSTISENNSFMTPFLLCPYFRAHPTTLLLKILGGRQIWRDRPPSPSRSPPVIYASCFTRRPAGQPYQSH